MRKIEKGFIPLSQLEGKEFVLQRRGRKVTISFEVFPDVPYKDRIGIEVERIGRRALIGGISEVLVQDNPSEGSTFYLLSGDTMIPAANWAHVNLAVKPVPEKAKKSAKRTVRAVGRSLQHEVLDAGYSHLIPTFRKDTVSSVVQFGLATLYSTAITKLATNSLSIREVAINFLVAAGIINFASWATHKMESIVEAPPHENGFRFSFFPGIQADRVGLLLALRLQKLVKLLPEGPTK